MFSLQLIQDYFLWYNVVLAIWCIIFWLFLFSVLFCIFKSGVIQLPYLCSTYLCCTLYRHVTSYLCSILYSRVVSHLCSVICVVLGTLSDIRSGACLQLYIANTSHNAATQGTKYWNCDKCFNPNDNSDPDINPNPHPSLRCNAAASEADFAANS